MDQNSLERGSCSGRLLSVGLWTAEGLSLIAAWKLTETNEQAILCSVGILAFAAIHTCIYLINSRRRSDGTQEAKDITAPYIDGEPIPRNEKFHQK